LNCGTVNIRMEVVHESKSSIMHPIVKTKIYEI